jgi:hypothetical protein
MVQQTAFQLTLDFLTSKPVVVEPSTEQVSSDAGLLPFRQLDERLRLTEQFAAALADRRDVGYIGHSFLEMTRMRVYGILADYADQNDHDVLRSDPIFRLLCDRSIKDDDLASQPTLSRFENAIDVRSFFRLQDVFIDQFIDSSGEPQRLFTAFWYRADSWPAQRWVVVKSEANAQGANRRAVVTNRLGATVLPGAAYDTYADRGESENRNKELRTGLLADRLSDHRYFANLFCLYLHTAAYNLLV